MLGFKIPCLCIFGLHRVGVARLGFQIVDLGFRLLVKSAKFSRAFFRLLCNIL